MFGAMKEEMANFFRKIQPSYWKLFILLQQNMKNHTNHKNQSSWKQKTENTFSV